MSNRKKLTSPRIETALSTILFRYAVVDLAQAPLLGEHVMGRLAEEAQPLLSPKLDLEVLAVGPWIVELIRVPELEPAIDTKYGNAPWGYFIETTVDIVSLRRALRRYNYVEIPTQAQPVLFRYWDPRVMDNFLKVGTKLQLRVLFEFIDRLEGPSGMFDVKRPAQFT
ncbi:MAG: DUF4123 domain-containing protein [Rhodobacteraceae bacterium]|nr:DUF4123 domain-containing protein [Paracoccaceae bacterium]